MRKQRISAGAIIVDDGRVLLVRHELAGRYDFWVAPGGGVLDIGDVLSAAVREAKEETGLDVDAIKPIYLEQMHQPTCHHIKTWVLCKSKGGTLSIDAPEATREHIVEVKYFNRTDLEAETRPIFPELLLSEFWDDEAKQFPDFKYIGMRAMDLY